MTNKIVNPNNDYVQIASKIEAENAEKEAIKNESEKILRQIELDGIPLTTYLSVEQVKNMQQQLMQESLEIQKQALLDEVTLKMNVAYHNPGIEIELTHEQAKLLDPFYPFDDEEEDG